MSNSELLPCPNPWCDDRSVQMVETREGGFFRVGCSCGVASPASTSEEAAIKFWNTRARTGFACSEDMIESANERINTVFAETAILLTHPDESRRQLAKDRVFKIMFDSEDRP